MSSSQNQLAQAFKLLHKPGQPLVLANVFDVASARAVAALPAAKALATTSYAVAKLNNTTDDDLDLATNLRQIEPIAAVANETGKPLTVDVQDGYGDQLEEAITKLVGLGVVGVNLEDVDKATQKQYTPDEAAERVRRALAAAAKAGVPDFAINARIDTLVHGGTLDDVIERGKKYLGAGANTVFVWGGSSRGVRDAEVSAMVDAFQGRLNVIRSGLPGALTTKQIADLGVARISVGPTLMFVDEKDYAKEAEKILL